MNSKYFNFTMILIVLSVFDIITTQYALTKYPNLTEGNPIMAIVTSSLLAFILAKAFGVMIIAGLYRRMKNKETYIVKAGKTFIIIIMLFVVGNNLIVIGSAISYGFPSPYSLQSPAWVNIDGSVDSAFIGHNYNNVTTYFTFDSNTSNPGGLTYTAQNRFYSTGMVRFAVVDWAHPQRLFLVFSNWDVAYTDSTGGIVTYENGYYADNVWPITGCSNCNDLHKIGVLTEANGKMSGFVDSKGEFFLSQGLSVVKFVRASDYSKVTYLTLVAGTDYVATTYPAYPPNAHDEISDMSIDSNGYIHILTGGWVSNNQDSNSTINHIVFNGSTRLYSTVVAYYAHSSGGTTPTPLYYSSMLNIASSNYTNIVFGYASESIVYLRYQNNTGYFDICSTSCAIITGLNGLQIYNGYAYIPSSAENKIYRFPTNISVSSSAGYIPGAGTESTDLPDITYTEKSINSLYANYYNTSKFSIQAKINFASGNWPTSVNYGINDQAYRWQIKLIDPNGVTVNSWDSGECDVSGITHCELSILREYTAPSIGWMPGTWYVKLYEHKIDSTLFGDAPMGNLALLTTSVTWTVLNGSTNTTGAISDSTESINSPSSITTISQFDGYVGLMGFGVNGVSKFLFSLAITIITFVGGMYLSKSGNIGLALSSLPYTFFAYISYVPKWVFVVYVIMLIMLSRVFK